MSLEFERELEELQANAFTLAKGDFNLSSPKQVAETLFEKMAIKPLKKTKTGFSTDSSVLEKLAEEYEICSVLLQHRMISKLKSTYVDALPLLVNEKSHRIHTNYNQAVAATGRLSSSDPNLQNIPIRGKEGLRIREAFIADAGKVLLSLDYSQVELRILAHMASDPVMIDSFTKGEDVHKRTASEVFEVSLEEVTKEQRSFAKTINFGLMYGMGVSKLSKTLNISRKEAESYLEKYYERYAAIYEWQDETLEKARKDLEVKTLFGRRRKLVDLVSNNHMLKMRAERIAINTPIQGTAADIIKLAMIEIEKTLKEKMPKAKMLLQVHDELIFEVPTEDALKTKEIIAPIMENVCPLKVPLLVEGGIGCSWAEAH